MKKMGRKRIVYVLLGLLLLGGMGALIYNVIKPKNDFVGSKEQQKHLEKLCEEKREELEAAEGCYDENVIVLQDTTKEIAEQLANKLGARVRLTNQGNYAAIYLPEGVTIADVYADEEYRGYLPDMTPDYYVSINAVDANNHELFPARPEYMANDSNYSSQTYLDYLNVRNSWDTSKGQGVLVAVIDTGIDTDHIEFKGKISDKSYNATEGKVVADYGMEVIEDEQGHGTAVAGVIAAAMDNESGIAGIAPDAELLVIKCKCDASGQFTNGSDLVFGLAYAIEQDADVVNMSFGTSFNIFSKYTKLAVDSDILCIASAGNGASALPQYPAADENVIGVGALAADDYSIAAYSNYGDNTLVMAPGTVFTTSFNGKVAYSNGTSLACPIVAATVALYVSEHPHTEYKDMCELLQASSTDLGSLGADWYYGFGALDMYAFLCEEKGIVTYEMLTDEVDNEKQIFVRGHTLQYMPEPERENVVFDGWYYDRECTDEVEYYTSVFTKDITLYAKWINEDEGSAYIYTTLNDGTVEIQSYTGKRRYLTIPSMIEGKTVSSIGESAFADNGRLRSVALPTTLTNIADRAFYNCTSLRSIDIPDKVKRIGNESFYGCVRLNYIGMATNGSLASIGNEAFAKCGISSVNLPKNLTSLGKKVFYGSTSLRNITVAEGNANYQIKNEALYDNDNTLLYYPAAKAQKYTVDSATAVVADAAFAYSRSPQIILPESLSDIGEECFSYSSITSLNIPATSIVLGKQFCSFCSRLNIVEFGKNYSGIAIPEEAFIGSSLKNISLPQSIEMIGKRAFTSSELKELHFDKKSKLNQFGPFAFAYTQLEEITFPASLQSVSEYGFHGCYHLGQVNFESESQCKIIETCAFMNCDALESINLPDSVISIGQQAFFDSGLTEIELGAGVVRIEKGAFSNCKKLEMIEVSEDNVSYSSFDGVLYNVNQTELLMFPAGRGGNYETSASTETIVGYAFSGADKLTNVLLNLGLKEISEYAFSGCITLETPVMPETLTTIGNNAFEYCTGMEGTMLIPKETISIGRYTFFNDYLLENIRIAPESKLSRIDYGAFAYCGIRDFTVPSNVTTMGQEVFTGCKNLLTVTYEADSCLDYVAAWTFRGADELRRVTFEEGSALQLVEARAFDGIMKLEKVDFTNCTQLTQIDNYAFNNCIKLEDLKLPQSLQEIGRYSFYGCSSLSRVDLPVAVSYIGRYAFAQTNNINVYFKAVVLPENLEENWNYDIAGYFIGTTDIYTSGDWTYALTEDSKASVISYNGTDSEIQLTQIDGYDVVSIGGDAFKNNTSLQHISLPDTLTGIYRAAFSGTSALQDITIPSSVEVIDDEVFLSSGISQVTFEADSKLHTLGRYVFAETKNLGSITVPKNVSKIKDNAFYKSNIGEISFGSQTNLEEIGKYAFSQSKLTTIEIPANVKKIDYNAFSENDNLTQVMLPQGKELVINGNAFYRTGLTGISIPENVTYIGELCFTACDNMTAINVVSANPNYSSIEGVLFDKNQTKLITCPAGKTGSYEITPNVTIFAFAAFEGSRLTNIIMPDDSCLTSIGYRTFYDCDNLESIDIPKSVHSIERYAFAYCDNLSSVNISEGSVLGGIYQSAFYNCSKLSGIYIPVGVQEISEYAFYGCSAMEDVTIAENSQLKDVYDHAFEYSGIKKFEMPSEVLEVGAYAFNKAKLNQLTINDKVTKIGEFAFADCGLSEVTVLNFPDTMVYMGKGVLQGAMNIEELTLPFLGTSVSDTFSLADLFGCEDGDEVQTDIKRLAILQGECISYGACLYFSTIEEVILPNELKIIDSLAFGGTGIKSIIIPDGVTYIGEGAFAIKSLESLYMPKELKHIGSYAFAGSSIEVIEISDKVEYIGDGVFSACSKLEEIIVSEDNKKYASVDGILYNKEITILLCAPAGKSSSVVIPDTVKEIGTSAFRECAVEELYLPKGLLKIGDKAFFDSLLQSIIISDSVEEIGESAFGDCTKLQSIIIPASVTKIGESAFGGCMKLQSIVIPASVTKIGKGVFENCSELEDIIIGSGTEIMPDRMFAGCVSLKMIELGENLKEIGNAVFSDCTSLEYIVIPEKVSQIGDSVFTNCGALRYIAVDDDNKSFSSVDGILYSKDKTRLLSVPKKISGTVRVPEGVTTIGSGAFSNCDNIEEVVIPNTVTTLGYSAFSHCLGMKKIVIPDSVTEIGGRCFDLCGSLSDIKIGKNVEYIGANAFENVGYPYDVYENGGLYIGEYLVYVNEFLMNNPKEFNVKSGTKLIASYVFAYKDIEKITIADSVKYVNGDAVTHLSNLKSIRIGKNVKSLRIESCSKLKSLSILHADSDKKVERLRLSELNNLKYLWLGKAEYPEHSECGNSGYMETCVICCDNTDTIRSFFGTQNLVLKTGAVRNEWYQEDYASSFQNKTVIYSDADVADASKKIFGFKTYYKGEWNLATFYADGMIVTTNPLLNGQVVQAPAESLVAEYMPEGATLIGWDINDDGVPDKLPSTLSEDLVANAIYDAPIQSMALTGKEVLEVGESATLSVEYAPYGYTHNNEVTFTSSDETVATVDENGMVTAKAAGSVTITATLDDDTSVTADHAMTITPLEYGIKLTETSGTCEAGEQLEIPYRLVLPDGDTDETTFTSDAESIATVEAGVVTAVAPGTATITITHGTYIVDYTVSVTRAMTALSLTETEGELNVDDTKQLTLNIVPADTTDDTSPIWYSNKPSVARVDDTGLVKAVGPGTAEIHAVIGKFEAVYTVTVKAPIKWIILNTTVGTMRIDRTKQLEVIYEPSNTTDDKTVTWSADNTDVAEVDENGLVTAKKAGTAVITGTVGTHEATYTVTVVGIKDEATGIIVTNSDDTPMDEDITLGVEEMDEEAAKAHNKSWWEKFIEFLKELYQDAAGHIGMTDIYDITLMQNNIVVQPDKDVDVEIPVPDDVLIDDAVIYRMEEDGTLTDMHASYVDGRFRFKTDHFSIYVLGAKSKQVYVTDIQLSDTEIALCPTYTKTLSVTVLPDDADSKDVIWTSSDETIATVDEHGEVTAISDGTATITVNATDGGNISAECEVIVGHHGGTATCGAKAVCEDCGEEYGELDSTSHHGGTATCTTKAICENCGKAYGELDSTNHVGETEILDAEAATCTEDGYSGDTYCKSCKAMIAEGEVLPANGHSFGNWKAPEAVCTEDRTEQRVCDTCGYTETRNVSAKDHEWEDDYTVDKEATCTEDGSESIHCSRCSVVKDSRVIPAIAHTFGEWQTEIEATYDKEGLKKHQCKACDTWETEIIPQLKRPTTGESQGNEETPLPSEEGKTPEENKNPGESGTAEQPVIAGSVVEIEAAKCEVIITSTDEQNPTVSYTRIKDKAVKKVTIPDAVAINGINYRVTSIADNAFANHKAITSIVIGKNITSIGKNAFKKCTKLKTVTIKSTKLNLIAANAFNGDKNLQKVTIKSTKLTSKGIGKNAFKGTNKKLTIKVPKSKVSAYKKFMKNKGNKKVKVTK